MSLLSVVRASHLLPRSTHYNTLLRVTCASWGSAGFSGRGYCFWPLVKITAQNIQPEMKRRKQEIGSVDKPTAFDLCCLLQACRRAFRLPPLAGILLPLLLWPGAVGWCFTGPSRGPGVRNCCSQRMVQDQLRQHHLVPPNYTEFKNPRGGAQCSHTLLSVRSTRCIGEAPAQEVRNQSRAVLLASGIWKYLQSKPFTFFLLGSSIHSNLGFSGSKQILI